jgi:hypothetical protein
MQMKCPDKCTHSNAEANVWLNDVVSNSTCQSVHSKLYMMMSELHTVQIFLYQIVVPWMGVIALLFSIPGITARIVAGDEKCPCCLPSPHGYEKDGIVAHE